MIQLLCSRRDSGEVRKTVKSSVTPDQLEHLVILGMNHKHFLSFFKNLFIVLIMTNQLASII